MEDTKYENMNKREIIAQCIEAGGANKEYLMQESQTNAAGFASQMTYLRMSGQFPVCDKESSIYSFVSADEWNELKEAAKNRTPGKSAPKRSAVERRQQLEKQLAKREHDLAQKQKAFDTDESRENELKLTVAECNLELTQINLEAVMAEKSKKEWAEAINEAAEAVEEEVAA